VLLTDAFGIISESKRPQNTLVTRCVHEFANMTCGGNTPNEIAWTYDGNNVINAPCQNNTEVFLAKRSASDECNIEAWLKPAQNDLFIRSISGPYGCTDRTNDGITETSMAIVQGTFPPFYQLCIRKMVYCTQSIQ